MLFSVNVPKRLKLARRCNNFGDVLAKCIGSWVSVFKIVFFTEHTEFDMPLVPGQGQLDKQAALVGLNHGQGHRWGERGLQCAVIRAESS